MTRQIGGLIIVYDIGADSESNLGARDVFHLFVLYVGCTVIRALLVLSAYALVNTTGMARLEWRWSIVATWGGLRGAVGLALGLIVFTDHTICDNVRTKVMFHTAGICALTVMINGVSMRYVIQLLGMHHMAPAKALLFTQAVRQIDKEANRREHHAVQEQVFASVAWDFARSYYLREKVSAPPKPILPRPAPVTHPPPSR